MELQNLMQNLNLNNLNLVLNNDNNNNIFNDLRSDVCSLIKCYCINPLFTEQMINELCIQYHTKYSYLTIESAIEDIDLYSDSFNINHELNFYNYIISYYFTLCKNLQVINNINIISKLIDIFHMFLNKIQQSYLRTV